jgi:S-(hydroxymethyl)glutathione dehydrogenase/alcohol dehydrogenase
MGLTSRAAIFRRAGEPMVVEEVQLAEPGPTDVVVRMAAAGVCGTDLHMIKGEWQRPTPMVLGHEGAGVVEQVGSEVTAVSVGDEVVLSWAPSCGQCSDCLRGRPAVCLELHRAIGAGTLVDGSTGITLGDHTVYRGTATGAWSEAVVVDQRVALPTSGQLPLEQAALLGCAALTGVGAVLFAARVASGSAVVVIGAGGVGQFCVQGARIAGAATIVVVDPVGARRDRALQLGATHAAAPEEAEAVVREASRDGVDYAFEAVGDVATSALALQLARSGGTVVMVGLPPAGQRPDLDPALFIRREKWLTGTMYGSEDPAIALPVLLEYVREGRLDLAGQLGPTFALEEINEAVSTSLSGSEGRVLVIP